MPKWTEMKITAPDQMPWVEEDPLFNKHGKETGLKAINDKQTNATICNVPLSNGLIQHRHVWDEVSKLEKYEIKQANLIKNGITLVIEVIPKDESKRIIDILPKDGVATSARVFNHYDKSCSVGVQGYGVRQVCMTVVCGRGRRGQRAVRENTACKHVRLLQFSHGLPKGLTCRPSLQLAGTQALIVALEYI